MSYTNSTPAVVAAPLSDYTELKFARLYVRWKSHGVVLLKFQAPNQNAIRCDVTPQEYR